VNERPKREGKRVVSEIPEAWCDNRKELDKKNVSRKQKCSAL